MERVATHEVDGWIAQVRLAGWASGLLEGNCLGSQFLQLFLELL